MTVFPFETENCARPNIGIVVLQTDETIEQEFRRIIPSNVANLYVSRIPSGEEVTKETLGEMSDALPRAVSLFPDVPFQAVAYCCTSGASVIGPETISQLIQAAVKTEHTTDPVSALVSACENLALERLALLSPYIEDVSLILRDALMNRGIKTPVFGSFNEANDATVAKITGQSIMSAGLKLASGADIDGLFLSCTNLKTLDLISPMRADLNLPVLSSNFVLAHHLASLADIKINAPDLGLSRDKN